MPVEIGGYCVCATDKTKTKWQMRGKFEHNFRLKEVDNADPDKRQLNEVLIGEPGVMDIFQTEKKDAVRNYKKNGYKTYIEYANEMKKEVEDATGKKVRKDAVLEVEVVLTYSHGSDVPLEQWKMENIAWLKGYFGEENVVSAVLHMDEQVPHIHAMVLPVERDQEHNITGFNAKKWLGGKQKLYDMQTSYAHTMERFGLRRGLKYSRSTHQDLSRFYEALNRAVSQKLPEKKPGQTDAEFRMEMDGYYQDALLRIMALENSIKRLEEMEKTRRGNESIFRKLVREKFGDYDRQVSILTEKCDEAQKKSDFYDYLSARLSTMEGEEAEETKELLNRLGNEGRKIIEEREKQMVQEET